MTQEIQEVNVTNSLRNVPFDHGFHFCIENGFTGVTAISLSEFSQKLNSIDVNSVLFHYSSGDFQKWIEDTLGDKELANRMCFIKRDISGEKLRTQLLRITQKRIKELQPASF